MKLIILTLVIAVASAGHLKRARRQTGCVDAFQNVPSPCASNPTKTVYFPHPTDTTKFLQCDVFGRMYIIQCPQNEEYNVVTTSCRSRNQATQHPSTQRPTPSPAQPGNPCTAANIAQNNVYFAIVGDPYHFIECDLKGAANVLPCPSGLKWNQNVIACVYPPNQQTAPPVILKPTTPKSVGTSPCNAQALASGKFFFPASDPHKFIQCDPWGDIYINSCPGGLIWNNFLETCYSTFQNNVVIP